MGMAQLWQSSFFWQQTLSRNFQPFSAACACQGMSVCAVPQGRTPLGLGAEDRSWAARAQSTAQMMVSNSPGWCWKGDDTPESPNKEDYDFETIFLKKVNRADVESLLTLLKSISCMIFFHEVNLILTGSVPSTAVTRFQPLQTYLQSGMWPSNVQCGFCVQTWEHLGSQLIWQAPGRVLQPWGERSKVSSWTCSFSWCHAGGSRLETILINGFALIPQCKYSVSCTAKGTQSWYLKCLFLLPLSEKLWTLRFSKYSTVLIIKRGLCALHVHLIKRTELLNYIIPQFYKSHNTIYSIGWTIVRVEVNLIGS